MENNTSIDDYIILFNDIISKLNGHFLDYDYDKKIIDRYIEYSHSSYKYLFQIYPIHFMHISLYDKYIEHGYNSLQIFNFSNYFYPYQKRCYDNYSRTLNILYNTVKGYDSITDITFNLDTLCL
jgi:hypothetical protein